MALGRGLVVVVLTAALALVGGRPTASADAPVDRPPCEGYVALTFDDGPVVPHTERILGVLAERGIPATFFLIGRQAEEHPEIVRRMRSDGHLVLSHSYSHTRLGDDLDPPGLARRGVIREILQGHEAVEVALGAALPRMWRSPRFSYHDSEVVRSASDGLGFVHVGGQATKDWVPELSDEEVLGWVERDLHEVGDGARFVLHDIARTAALLPRIIDLIHSRGFCATTLRSDGSVMTAAEQTAFDELRSTMAAFSSGVWGVVRLVTGRPSPQDLGSLGELLVEGSGTTVAAPIATVTDETMARDGGPVYPGAASR